MLSFLQSILNLKQSKKKCIYYSNTCPFGCSSKKSNIFRYNTKLKVVKCFSCGGSAKELYWLKLQIYNPIEFRIKQLKTDTFTKLVYKENYNEYIESRIKYIKENANDKDEVIIKVNDENLPF